MQTERVTFLTTPDYKVALDAFAHRNGMAVVAGWLRRPEE